LPPIFKPFDTTTPLNDKLNRKRMWFGNTDAESRGQVSVDPSRCVQARVMSWTPRSHGHHSFGNNTCDIITML